MKVSYENDNIATHSNDTKSKMMTAFHHSLNDDWNVEINDQIQNGHESKEFHIEWNKQRAHLNYSYHLMNA